MGALTRGLLTLRYGARAAARNGAALLTALLLLLGTANAQAGITIAALGDSLTQGHGLPQEDGFVPQLEAWLHENGHPDATVLNAGVSGDTTAGGLSRIGWTLSGGDVDAVIVALGGNDLLRGIDPAESRKNLDGILKAITDKGLPALLAGMRAPGNYGPDYKQAFDAMYPELARKYDAIYYPFFLQGLGAGEDAEAARGLMQPDGLHPNAKGVARIVADIGPAVLKLVERAEARAAAR